MEFYPPFSFPLRVLKGTFEVSTGSPCQTKIKIKIKSDYARPFRAKARGGRKTSGLLAPNPRQGNALHPHQSRLQDNCASGSAAEASACVSKQPLKGRNGLGLRGSGYAAGGLPGAFQPAE